MDKVHKQELDDMRIIAENNYRLYQDAQADRVDLLAALDVIAKWAHDEGPLRGKSPMDVSVYADRAILTAVKGTP
jgi:hypothetical protein